MERALVTPRDRIAGPPLVRRRIRLMLVDDSTVARAVLSRMIESDPSFEIIAVACTAEGAIEALGECRVDIVILDLEMPGAGGLKSIPRIIAAAHGAKVMIVSSLAEAGAEQSVAALALGATDTLPKPGTGQFHGRFSEILLSKLKALGYAAAPAYVAIRGRVDGPPPVLLPSSAEPLELLAIGASTGGIHALGMMFKTFPRRIGVPILVTQHLPEPFMPIFARQLATVAQRECLVAEDGMVLSPDRILLAPGNAHLTLQPDTRSCIVRLTRGRSASGCMPSVDPMFASAAAIFRGGAFGVVLTGMGRDGLEGAARLVAAGGSVFVQDEASSAVWGMPRAVLESGLACGVMPPDKIARRITARIEEHALCR